MPLALPLCPFPFLVVLPPGECCRDVRLLAFFRTAAEEYYEPLAILSEVDAVTRTKINLELVNASPNALRVRKIPLLYSCESSGNFRGCFFVQAIGPRSKRTVSTMVQVFAYFDHILW
jgi:hypothetical protein